MKKVVLIFLILLVCKGSVFSQVDAQLSQYMFHHASFNPAAVGEGEMIQTTLQIRNQWIGIPNAPGILALSINSPINIGTSKNGIGVKFMNDRAGLVSNDAFYIQYAYKMKLDEGVFSLGADIGGASIGFNGDSVRQITLGTYHTISSDLAIPIGKEIGTGLDLNLGLFYSTNKYYAGLSYLHFNKPKVYWGEKSEFKLNATMFLTGGYNYSIPETKYVLKPSMLFKTDFSSLQLDISGRIEYDTKYWGGMSYRIQDAIVILAGLNVAGGLSLGCSYDVPTSHLSTASYGSLELVAVYSFEYVFGKRTNKYKSIRIL